MPRIVTISGTSRPDNYTSKALAVVNDELARRNLDPVLFDAREMKVAFPGEPLTSDARILREAIEDATGVVLATPEYHGGYSAMIKLIIENLGFPSALSGKPVALLGVASGRIGAIKSLEQLRGICAHVGAIVLPGSVSVAGVRGAFDPDGNCTDPGVDKALRGLAASLEGFIVDFVHPRNVLEEMVRQDVTVPWTTEV